MSGNKKRYKLAIVSPTPFYYHIPLYQKLSKCPQIDLTVYYCSKEALTGKDVEAWYKSKGFMADEGELLKGYGYKFLKNYSLNPSFTNWLFGLVNFGIWREIKKGEFDAVILQAWNNFTWWLAFLACLGSKTPIYFMSDANVLSEPLKPNWKKKIKNLVLKHFFFKKAAGFLAQGIVNKGFYEYYGVPGKKILKMHYNYGFEWFLTKAEQLNPKREEIRQAFNLKKDDFVMLFVGRLSEEKNILDLLKAYEKSFYKNKKLFIAGDGPLRKQIEKHIKDSGIKGVYLTGFQAREKICEFYALADAVLLASSRETWGMVINEAMCFSLPIIASNRVGSVADLVKNGYNGFIFSVGDVGKITECMERVMRFSHEERLIFGERSYDIINKWMEESDPVFTIIKILKGTKK